MSITPNVPPNIPPSAPPSNEGYIYDPPPTPRWIPLAIVVLFLGLGALLYTGYGSRTQLESALAQSDSHADVLSKELEQTNSRVALLRAQLEVTTQKLGLTEAELARARTMAQQIQQDQQSSDAKLVAQIGQVQQENETKIGQVSTEVTGAKTDIAATKKDLDETKKNLSSAVGDLNGQGVLIARNGEELEVLKHMNDRNIYDFKLSKSSKKPQHVGPVQILLRATDPKHYKFTMTVIADDKSIEKKDRNVDEPMQFYVRGVRAPYELVVFEVTKDGANGYLSTPKDTGSSAPAGAANSGGATSAPANAPAAASAPANSPAAASAPAGPPHLQ